MRENNKKIIQSVDKAFEIIRCFENQEELGITEISKKLDMHKSTVFGLVSTLNANEILVKNDATGKYRLGLELYRLGTKVNISLIRLALPYLERLVSEYHETANLVQLKDTTVMYLEKVEGSHSMRISTSVGGVKPIHCTAVGKAILAFLNKEDLERIIDKLTLDRYTDSTIVDKDSLIKSLEEIKIKGYAEDLEELEIGLSCVAAPIFNQYKVPFAAISISGPKTRMSDEVRKEMGGALVKFANEISQNLGYE